MSHHRRPARFARILLLGLMALGACQTLPAANYRRIPDIVAVADASPARRALNVRVYDAVVEMVGERHYQRKLGLVDWPAEAATRRAAVVDQADEVGFYGGLNGLLGVLGDRHTAATRPEVHRLRSQRRLAEGLDLGLTLVGVEGVSVVDRVRPDGPAAAAGVQVGWRVDAVDGAPFVNAQTLLQGERVWTFTDVQDETHKVTLAAAPLPRSIGQARRTDDDVLVLAFDAFDPATREWLHARMVEARADPPRGVVIDLRLNGGGDARELGRMLAPFFAERVAYAIHDLGPLRGVTRRTGRWPTPYAGPLAVLQSSRSASAAEVFAAAVQEQRRGVVVGGVSRGAVVGSRHFDLPDGGLLSVGIKSFRTGSGVVLEHVGVTPDIAVAPNLNDARHGRDTVLEAAIKALLDPAPTPEAQAVETIRNGDD